MGGAIRIVEGLGGGRDKLGGGSELHCCLGVVFVFCGEAVGLKLATGLEGGEAFVYGVDGQGGSGVNFLDALAGSLSSGP